MLLACATTYALCHSVRLVVPMFLSGIMGQFRLNYFQGSLAASAYDLGYGLTLLAGGKIASVLGKRRAVVLAGLVLGITSLLSTRVSSFGSLLATRAIAGLGFSLYFTAGSSLLTEFFATGELGLAFGLHSVGAASGRLAGSFLPLLTPAWRQALLVMGVLGLVIAAGAAVVFRWVVPDGGARRQPGQDKLPEKGFWIICLLQAAVFPMFGTTVALFPVYLVRLKGVTPAESGLYLAFLTAVTILGNPLMGTLADRHSKPAVIGTMLALAGVAFLVSPWLFGPLGLGAASLALGIALAGGPAVTLSYLASQGRAYASPFAIGVFNTVGVATGEVINLVLGWSADRIGLPAALSLFGCYLLAGAGLAAWIHRQSRRPGAGTAAAEPRS